LTLRALTDVLLAPGWRRHSDYLVALLTNGFKVGVVNWPCQEEIKVIVTLGIIQDTLQRRLDFGATKLRMSSPRRSLAPCEEDRTMPCA
jgi:hypothetical protein